MLSSAILLACLGSVSLGAADVLSDFHPSSIRSDYGAVSNVEFSTELIQLDPGVLAFHPDRAMRDFRFAEPVWIIGYQTEVLDANDAPPRENYLCHTFFGDQRVTQHDDREMLALYSDAFTPRVRLPDGFGFRLAAGEPLHWMPLFNNRQDQPARIRMRGVISVIREKDREAFTRRTCSSCSPAVTSFRSPLRRRSMAASISSVPISIPTVSRWNCTTSRTRA
jgi:hypothetical protein